MGRWGQGIFQDDLAADVRATWEVALAEGLGTEAATRRVIDSVRPPPEADHESFRTGSEYEEKVFWLALAAAQSERGRLQPQIRRRALVIIADGADLDQPELIEAGPAAVSRRRRALQQLAAKLQGPQPKPSRPRRPRPRSERRRTSSATPRPEMAREGGVIFPGRTLSPRSGEAIDRGYDR